MMQNAPSVGPSLWSRLTALRLPQPNSALSWPAEILKSALCPVRVLNRIANIYQCPLSWKVQQSQLFISFHTARFIIKDSEGYILEQNEYELDMVVSDIQQPTTQPEKTEDR